MSNEKTVLTLPDGKTITTSFIVSVSLFDEAPSGTGDIIPRRVSVRLCDSLSSWTVTCTVDADEAFRAATDAHRAAAGETT